METCLRNKFSHNHASADAHMSSFELNSDDSHESLASLRVNPHKKDSLEDILTDMRLYQSPAEAPSPTLHPTEPSETPWDCIESIPSTSDPLAYDPWDEPETFRKTQHKEVLLY